MSQHIVRAYDAELTEIDRLTAEMGGLAEKLLADAFTALERRDPGLAESAAASDPAIDEMERRVQERAVLMIAKRQPMAGDLRHIMTVMKIAGDLERVGDLAKNIANRARAVAGEAHPKPLMSGLRHMSDTLTAGDITLDRSAHRVTRAGREIALGPTEYRLLEVLLESNGRVLSRSHLIDRVWGTTAEIDERTVDVHVGRLRKAMVREQEPDPIRTIRGAGYVLAERSG
jgi:DNA-binding winged helix-turn-helix (wHTH) protein